jgi:hypothetical protein
LEYDTALLDRLARNWLERPSGRIPLLPSELDLLRARIETDSETGRAWADTCSLAAEFLGEAPGPLQPTPIANYYHNDQATINNNLSSRFWSGWTACAWKAVIDEDEPALCRTSRCLEIILRTHREHQGIQIIPEPDSEPKRFYYLTSRSFYPEQMIVLVELMRSAGFADCALLSELVERLLFLTVSAVAACEQLHMEKKPYWNGDNCHGACLLSVAAILPDHPDANLWQDLGWRNMSEYFGEQSVLPDGTFHEAFPWAEGYGLEFLYPVLAILRGSGELDIPNLQLSPTRTLKDAIQWQLDVASPLGEIPSINDTNAHESIMGGYSNLPMMGQWAGMSEVWSTFRTDRYRLPLWSYAHRPDESPEPAAESLLFRDIGWSVIRSGQGPNAFYAMFDHGIHQSGHCMPQCLTFDMVCHAHHWVVNSGCAPHYCTYDQQNTWHRTTKAGNCLKIDGQDIPPKTDGELLEWRREEHLTRVTARHQGFMGVIHSRTLMHLDDGPLVVIDEVRPGDGKPHQATSYWHINGSLTSRDNGGFTFLAGSHCYLTVLSKSLSSDTIVSEGPCGGLGRLKVSAGSLPNLNPIAPGDPGWEMVPYLEMDSVIPPGGSTQITAFIPEKEASSPWSMAFSNGTLHISKGGDTRYNFPVSP